MEKEKEIKRAVEVLKALGHPTRIKILEELILLNKCNVNFLEDKLELTQSNTSQHLICLRNAGIIKVERSGNENFYSLSEEMKKCICCFMKVALHNSNKSKM